LLGFPGLFFAVLVFLLREPARGAKAAPNEVSLADARWQRLIADKSFVLLCLGYALLGLATNNLSIWGAIFYTGVHKLDLATIGFWSGIFTLAAGIPATAYGGVLADLFRRRSRGGRMFYGAILSFVSIPLWLVFLFANDYKIAFFAQFLLLGVALSWLGAAAADATEIAGVKLRGVAVAIYFFAVNFAAYLIGSTLIGQLNDSFKTTANPEVLRYTLLVCPISCLLSAICLWFGGRSLNLNERESSN
jgi:MFS family permease